PALQPAVAYDFACLRGHAFGVEEGAGELARAMRILEDANARGEHLGAELALEEGRVAVEARSARRGDQMPEQAAGDVGVENDGHFPRGKPAGAEPRDGAAAGGASHGLGGI